MTDDEKKEAATQFTDEWKNDDDQHCGSKAFWVSLFRDVYGIEHAENFVEFEYKFGAIGIVDAYIPTIHMIIEQKGRNTNTKVLNSKAKSIIDKIGLHYRSLCMISYEGGMSGIPDLDMMVPEIYRGRTRDPM